LKGSLFCIANLRVMAKKKRIALVAGGYSGEYVISIGSAAVAEKHIDPKKFEVFKIIIEREKWYHVAADGTEYAVDRADFTLKMGRKRLKFDAVLMIIHGTPGEDGKLQGYFDMLNIPYTSCDAATSALTFNKRFTVAAAAFAGINVAKSQVLFKKSFQNTPLSIEGILNDLRLPVFVKPNNGGSSIGMSRVEKGEDLAVAIDKAFNEDDQVLVEEFIAGREFTIGVMRTKGKTVVLPICEVRSKKAFFDYEAKYEGASEELIPAPIDEKQAKILRGSAQKIYEALNCRGIVRIDFIWNEATNQPFMLEVNTVPGQSEASIVPQMVRAHGWTMTEFYTRQLQEIV
jgi:D-alanine-D-alanine ligase